MRKDIHGLLDAERIAAAAFEGAEAVVGVVGDMDAVQARQVYAVLCHF